MPLSPPLSVGNLVSGGVAISYTGNFVRPVNAELIPPGLIIPTGVTSGATTITGPGVGISVFNYSEGDLIAGGLQTLSLDNVVTLGRDGFGVFNCNGVTSISAPEMIYSYGVISIGPLPALTALLFPKLKSTQSFSVNTLPVLTSISLPELQAISTFNPNTMALLTTLSIPSLVVADGNFAPFTMASLTTLSAPSLAYVTGNVSPNTMAALTTFSFPALLSIAGTFAPNTMASLVTISLPVLQRVTGALSVATMASLTTVSFAGMISYGSTITMTTGLGNLTTVTLGTIGTLKAISGTTINLSGQKLTTANVNAILALLVSLDGTNGTTLWGTGKTLTINGGTNGAPSGQGATDKTTLQGRGATITTN